MSNKVAVGFSNCLGNFILMLPALKILRERKECDKIDMITDSFMWEYRDSVKTLASVFFDGVKVDHNGHGYDKVYYGQWSQPDCLLNSSNRRSISWSHGGSHSGVHEAWTYLDMIGAKFDDFSGYPKISLPGEPILSSKNIVALVNSSDKRGSGRGSHTMWHGFQELSQRLVDSGFKVVLVGQDDELDGCEGQNFVGKLDILGTMKVISQCNLVICPDTGIMHVADMLGVPILLLAGPTPMTKSAPIASRYEIIRNFHACAPCFQSGFWNSCKDHECMRNISVDQVFEKVCKMVPRNFGIEKSSSVDIVSRFVSLISYQGTDRELIYDPSYDRIGDLFGAMFILRRLKEQSPEMKMSWYNSKHNFRDNSDWFNTFNIFDWIDLDIENRYDALPKGGVVISSRRNFSVWRDLQALGMSGKWYPRIIKKGRPEKIKLPKKYISLHVLLRTSKGERSTSYVKRREMDLEKYERLCQRLKGVGLSVVRIGHHSDYRRKMKGIIDLSNDEISLDDSLRIVVNSSLFVGGDTGHKLVASASGVPCIVEIDEVSCNAGGLGGCDPSLVTSFKLGVSEDVLFDKVMKLLCIK